MFVAINNDFVLFRTPFNNTHDLVQKFRGINNNTLTYNAPIDFAEAGLIDNSKWDYWHIDLLFNVSNDEATPPFVNGSHIGANHGQPCAVIVFSENHGKTYSDIGSLWQDESGVKFTLIRVSDSNVLQFVSENQGENECKYKFIKTITGDLKYVENGCNKAPITIQKQHSGYLSRSNNYLKKELHVYNDGKWSPFFSSTTCEMAEIREEYNIINPATVAKELRDKRPKDKGYQSNLDLSEFGKPMLNMKLTYRVLADGTVLSTFDLKKLMDVDFHHYHGIMYQEKLDVYGGGVYRCIPKTKPIDCEEGVFDFTKPVALNGKPFPSIKHISKEYFQDPDSPPDRIIELFKDKQGDYKLAFAGGFLPEYDCAPQVRKNNLESALLIKHTRKAYPNVAYGSINTLKGIGYKKFFIPTNDNPVYTVAIGGKKYVFANFIKQGSVKLPIDSRATLLEKSGDIEWFQDCKDLIISGSKGSAVLVINE